MRNEAELRELLDDVRLYLRAHRNSELVHGFESGLSYVLGLPEDCGDPRCKADHAAALAEALERIRAEAKAIRAKRAAHQKARLQ